jgi:hypothetical protein
MTSFFIQVDYWHRKTTLMDTKIGQFLASGSSALLSYWLVWPFEVLKNMAQAETACAGNTTACRAKYIYSSFGLKGFYRGIVPGS